MNSQGHLQHFFWQKSLLHFNTTVLQCRQRGAVGVWHLQPPDLISLSSVSHSRWASSGTTSDQHARSTSHTQKKQLKSLSSIFCSTHINYCKL